MFQASENMFCLNLPQIGLSPRKHDKFNSGRWKPNEHEKFIDAVIRYGNDWKMVQKIVKSRSSTQARSHAQKFLLKLKKKLKIEPDSTNKLSADSIDKIIREIVESSSSKANPHLDKEKLVKMILGFSNLLAGKSSAQALNDPYQQSSQNTYYADSFYDQGHKDEYPKKKVFNIQKVVKGGSVNQSKQDSEDIIKNAELSNTKIQINQITNHNDLIKFLLQHRQTDPNTKKNVINIISINICDKAEGAAYIPQPTTEYIHNRDTNTKQSSSSGEILAQIINSGVKFPIQHPSNSEKESLSYTMKDTDKAVFSGQEDIRKKSCSDRMTAVTSSPESNSFEKDFYENSSPNFFSNLKSEGEEYDKLFEWN